MPIYEERVKYLLQLFADDKATADEIKEMLALLQRKEGDKILESFITRLRHEPDYSSSQTTVDWDNLWNNIHQSAMNIRTPVRKMKWIYRAAAIILVIGTGAFYISNKSGNAKVKKAVNQEARVDDV